MLHTVNWAKNYSLHVYKLLWYPSNLSSQNLSLFFSYEMSFFLSPQYFLLPTNIFSFFLFAHFYFLPFLQTLLSLPLYIFLSCNFPCFPPSFKLHILPVIPSLPSNFLSFPVYCIFYFLANSISPLYFSSFPITFHAFLLSENLMSSLSLCLLYSYMLIPFHLYAL